MVYIQLSENVKGYNKVRIKELNYFDNVGEGADKSISFKYIVYKNVSLREEILYDKFVVVSDDDWIQNVFEQSSFKNLNAFDSICRILLQYLIEENYETGTLEVV